MNPILEAIKVYDLLRDSKEYKKDIDRVRPFIANHAAERRLVSILHGRDVVACAVTWRIQDPHDVMSETVAPGDHSRGRYVYLPLIYVRPELRDGSTLRQLIEKILDLNQGVDRVAYKRLIAPRRKKRWGARVKRVHVLRGFTNANDNEPLRGQRGVQPDRSVDQLHGGLADLAESSGLHGPSPGGYRPSSPEGVDEGGATARQDGEPVVGAT